MGSAVCAAFCNWRVWFCNNYRGKHPDSNTGANVYLGPNQHTGAIQYSNMYTNKHPGSDEYTDTNSYTNPDANSNTKAIGYADNGG